MKQIKEKLQEAFSAVLPITVIVLVMSVFLVPLDTGTAMTFMVGSALLVVGMGLFQLGADLAMIPMGEGMGVQISKTKKISIIALLTFLIGVIITIAEPDLQVLANQVQGIPNNVLIMTVAVGVGLMLVVAIFRILLKKSLSYLLLFLYVLVFAVAFMVPRDFIAVAFDSGGVTTGPITVPFIMAMGVGIAAIRSDKDAADDSFGLVAICSIGPILSVLILGAFYKPDDADYKKVVMPQVDTTRNVIGQFVHNIPDYFKEVLIAIVPVVVVFVLLQLFTRRYTKRQIGRMLVGFLYTLLGLVLFLTGVNVGFMPVGHNFGARLAEGNLKWLLLPLGMLIGYFIVKAEPAVQVLNRQIEEVTDGAIPKEVMNRCLSIGVCISVGLSMVRVLTGISILWIIIPGYAISLILTFFVPKIFVGIAFDSGGVCSGPMTTTFLLPLAMGASEAVGGNVMTDAFGVVALVAMTPLIAVQIMGLVYVVKQKKETVVTETQQFVLEDDDDIVEYEEDSYAE